MNDCIEPDSYAYVFQDMKRSWLVKVKAGERFFTSDGHIPFDEVIGKPFGSIFKTHLGTPLAFLRPTPIDFALNSPRLTNIIYPKDAGLILLYAGIRSGIRVVESGAGSGALTTILASTVQPAGHVYTYEIRQDAIEITTRNLKRAKVEDFCTIHHKSIIDGIEEQNVDAVILDLGDPWSAVPVAWQALRPSGVLASYSPTIEQVIKTVSALSQHGYCDVRSLECFIRDYLVREGKTRPSTRMIGHTGYLTFARKVLGAAPTVVSSEDEEGLDANTRS